MGRSWAPFRRKRTTSYLFSIRRQAETGKNSVGEGGELRLQRSDHRCLRPLYAFNWDCMQVRKNKLLRVERRKSALRSRHGHSQHKIQSLPELRTSSRSFSDSQKRSTAWISTTKVEIKNETSKNQREKNLQTYTTKRFTLQKFEVRESISVLCHIHIPKFRGAK